MTARDDGFGTVHPTSWWHRLDDGRLQCDLCPPDCRLHEGQRGLCFVRARRGDAMVLTTYGRSSGFCIDPIEKKPLNHFYPGSRVFSFGMGKPRAALERINVALELITRSGVPYFRGICLLMAAEIHARCGRLNEARDFVGQVAETVADTGSAMLVWFAHLMTARIAQTQGDWSAALAALSAGLGLGREHGYRHFYFWPRETLSNLFCVALEHGIEPECVTELIAWNKMPAPRSGLARIAWPWPVKVFALGELRIEIDGNPLAFVGKVQKAPLNLFKLLIALGGHAVAEHVLEEALWPDSEGDAGKQALATTLNRLRKLIGPEVITRHGGVLSINADVVWCNAQALLALIAAQPADRVAALSAIERLYRGPFLSADEHRWALPLRDSIEKAVVAALLHAARHDVDAGHHDEAFALCSRGIEIDSLCEPFYEIAMRSLVATGRNAEAVRLYRQCQHELSARLRVAPSPATHRAYLTAPGRAPAPTGMPPAQD